MKFWELVSAFRVSPEIVREVLSRPAWREPYGRWYEDFNRLVDAQDRGVLDARVPLELSREVARLSSLTFQYSPRHGTLRESWSEGMDPGPLMEMTALEVHDRFGGSVIEEVGEYGSFTVTPAEGGTRH